MPAGVEQFRPPDVRGGMRSLLPFTLASVFPLCIASSHPPRSFLSSAPAPFGPLFRLPPTSIGLDSGSIKSIRPNAQVPSGSSFSDQRPLLVSRTFPHCFLANPCLTCLPHVKPSMVPRLAPSLKAVFSPSPPLILPYGLDYSPGRTVSWNLVTRVSSRFDHEVRREIACSF